ncbi:MAG: GH116 family glycosyl hydrolase [candidate division KSB1 bacterium]|nr:GH116 family glycosyl hydrolase [candidate division KSB1 bacterium]MDZ7275719.1 GH116 family glycosyl hydrolase [candidate division KSB1 bacterium]MDZ7284590.1 GH116 family glycosyl hydrolase [candidate division KSB1 bacterium]MDZ7297991.1 GH116 family glycosyl hydrolase [candidate division KSB1 bacterium]MDZ7305841.1 GH116 family glycosyl hydrolase [candidate division KSB1 bacterium]
MKRVAYLLANPANPSREEQAGWHFLTRQAGFKHTKLSLADLTRRPALLQNCDLLWWHYDSEPALPAAACDPGLATAVQAWLAAGGALLLTLLAAPYVCDLGLEAQRPNFLAKGGWPQDCWAAGYHDRRGFAGYGDHPIFAGLQRGVFTWSPQRGSAFAAAFYEAPAAPQQGSVIAVGRAYIRLDEHWRLITEYQAGAGRVLTIGSFLFFDHAANLYRRHLEAFVRNCLAYLLEPPAQAVRTHWPLPPATVKQVLSGTRSHSIRTQEQWRVAASGLGFAARPASDNFFDLGGRRILLMGHERGGLDEIWCPPFRGLQHLRTAFRIGEGGWLGSDTLTPVVTITPETLQREYRLPGAVITEHTFADLHDPAAALHYRVEAQTTVEIFLTAVCDLRLMWPYSEQATGNLLFGWQEGPAAVFIQDESSTRCVMFGGSRMPEARLAGHYARITEGAGQLHGEPTALLQVAMGLRYVLAAGAQELTIVFAGSAQGEGEARQAYRRLLQHPARSLRRQARHFERLLRDAALVVTPDETFNAGLRWALAASDRFFVATPGVGAGFMAGFATTASGWKGGHEISGRPGYAWYFGRDSVWTALAALAYGDFTKVKQTLELLGTHQDVDGKIFHELTMNGQAHFDAADATPLYVMLMGRYLRASGDRDFVRQQFPRVQRAMGCCLATDRDGDHFIENTHVGHGWVEGGALFPAHAEFYLNACWTAALWEAGNLAKALGQDRLLRRWARHWQTVRHRLPVRFWNKQTRFYNFAKRTDGTFVDEKTIMPAVAIYLGLIPRKRAEICLQELAGLRFSTDWGVRLVSCDSPIYDPAGYHTGSVWPLFTGWLALAEYRSYRPTQGFVHLMNNLLRYRDWAAGCVPEVLHGEQYRPAGVCPHQAWSEAMVLLPVLEGMLGLECDALRHHVTLRPALPPQWDFFEVKNVRLGRHRLHLRMHRRGKETVYSFRTDSTMPMTLRFQAILPLGTEVKLLRLNDSRQFGGMQITHYRDFPELEFELYGHARLAFHHDGGIGVMPPVSLPRVNEPSRGFRLLREEWACGILQLTVEGRPGREYELELFDPDHTIRNVENARIVARHGSMVVLGFELQRRGPENGPVTGNIMVTAA